MLRRSSLANHSISTAVQALIPSFGNFSRKALTISTYLSKRQSGCSPPTIWTSLTPTPCAKISSISISQPPSSPLRRANSQNLHASTQRLVGLHWRFRTYVTILPFFCSATKLAILPRLMRSEVLSMSTPSWKSRRVPDCSFSQIRDRFLSLKLKISDGISFPLFKSIFAPTLIDFFDDGVRHFYGFRISCFPCRINPQQSFMERPGPKKRAFGKLDI